MVRLLAVLLALTALAGTPGAARGDPEVVDRVVATINSHVITLSSLEFFVRVVFVDNGGRLAADKPIGPDTLKRGLGLLIGERLASDEAESLKVFDVDDKAVDDAVAHFEAQLGGSPDAGEHAALQRLLTQSDFQVSELRAVLRRRLRAHLYLDSQVSLQARVKEADVDDFMVAHRQELGPNPGMEVRDRIRQKMQEERKRELVLSVLRRLHARAKVRIVDSEFDGADAALIQGQTPDATLDFE